MNEQKRKIILKRIEHLKWVVKTRTDDLEESQAELDVLQEATQNGAD